MVNRDFYQIMATTPGYSSVRDKTKGTWLIQNFCDALEENGSRYVYIGGNLLMMYSSLRGEVFTMYKS